MVTPSFFHFSQLGLVTLWGRLGEGGGRGCLPLCGERAGGGACLELLLSGANVQGERHLWVPLRRMFILPAPQRL